MGKDDDSKTLAPPHPGEADLVLRALRALPALPLRGEPRIRARVTGCYRAAAARHRHVGEQLVRLARPIFPLSIAGLALGYVVWVFRTAALLLP